MSILRTRDRPGGGKYVLRWVVREDEHMPRGAIVLQPRSEPGRPAGVYVNPLDAHEVTPELVSELDAEWRRDQGATP